MSEETSQEQPDSQPSKRVADSPASARTAPPLDQWSARRAELKRHKRRAHRRKINASNTPG